MLEFVLYTNFALIITELLADVTPLFSNNSLKPLTIVPAALPMSNVEI